MRMPTQTLDLRTEVVDADLWKPVNVDVAALAATGPAEAPVGKLKLLEMIKDRPADDQKFAQQAYDYCQMNMELGQFCDPVKWAMKALDAHHSEPASSIGTMAFKIGEADTFDRDKFMISSDATLTTDQKKQVADKAGPILADDFFSQPRKDTHEIHNLMQKALASARASVLGGGSPASPSLAQQNATAQQSTAQQNNAPQQNPASASPTAPPADPTQPPPPPQDDPTAKAVKKAKKGKSALDKLHGILGH
jgi:hypothetical protein